MKTHQILPLFLVTTRNDYHDQHQFQKSLGDCSVQRDGLLVGFSVLVLYFEDFMEEGEELLVVDEVVVDVLDDEIDLAGLLEELEQTVESIGSDLVAALVVFFLTSTEDFDDVVDARVVFLLDLDAKPLEVIRNGLLLDQQGRRLSRKSNTPLLSLSCPYSP